MLGVPGVVEVNRFGGLESSSTKQKGFGIGLAVAKEVVDNRGGLIRVYSRVGEGTRFTITLPAADDGAVEVEDDAS